MKTKSFFFALFAFAIGTTCAFASFLVPEDVYVKAQFGNEQSPVFCINTEVQCDHSTAFPCIVIVPLLGGGSHTASTMGTRKTYKAGCITLIGRTSMGAQMSPLSGSDRPTRVIVEP